MVSPDRLLRHIEIREMVTDDVPIVAALDRAENPDPWTESIFLRELQLPISHTLLAIVDCEPEKRIAGFVTFWTAAEEVQLHKIVVSRPLQRCGLARRLMREMTDLASARNLSRSTLEVRRNNTAALKLYQAMGYEIVAVRKGYYDKAGGDALIMSAEFASGGIPGRTSSPGETGSGS